MAAVGKVIHDVYYNLDSPSCYAGVNKVYNEAKKRDKRVKIEDVREFLARQDAYTLHKPVKRKYQRNATKTSGIDVDWQADLADMQSLKKLNQGYTFILVCIDVLSRFAFVQPLKNKTAESVAHGFETIVKRTKRRCWILTTDRGKEFSGSAFQDMLARNDIQHHYATSPDVKCAIVERYIRTLKSRIWRYFTRTKTLNYIKPLQKIVAAINNSTHRTIGMAPSAVSKKNEKEVWSRLYGQKLPPQRFVYKAGDHVRITKEKHKLSKGYQPNFTLEEFVITKVLENRIPHSYRLCDLQGEDVEGVFYREELVRVSKRSKRALNVEEILKSELRKKQLWHLVRLTNTKQIWMKDSELTLKS